jgi:hypothetical protein
MMAAVLTSETSVCFNETARRYIPEGFHLHTHSRKKMKPNKAINSLNSINYLIFSTEKPCAFFDVRTKEASFKHETIRFHSGAYVGVLSGRPSVR